MCIEKASPFMKMIIYTLAGIVLGIIFGLIFSLLIAYVSHIFGGFPGYARANPDYGFASFLGMGFGSILGAVLGGAHANRK